MHFDVFGSLRVNCQFDIQNNGRRNGRTKKKGEEGELTP